MATFCDPFRLFPEQVETAKLWRYTAPGLSNELITVLRVIVKHATQTNQPTEYGSRTSSRRFHIQTDTVPENLRENMELWPNLMVELSDGRVYQVTQASRGDDMDMGETRFIIVYGDPYGRDSI